MYVDYKRSTCRRWWWKKRGFDELNEWIERPSAGASVVSAPAPARQHTVGIDPS